MVLKHFADKHPLVFNKDPRGSLTTCDQCEKKILGSCYSCTECNFDLHKSCAEAELPHELHHPIHPKHPLILFKRPPYDEKTCTCNGCNERWRKFVYHCTLCKFDLDIKCAFLPLIKESKVHEHPLTLFRRSISFTCDVCGQEGKGMLYQCVLCSFWVHLSCVELKYALLPLTKEAEVHEHPLTLLRRSISFTCDVCGQEGKGMLYQCAHCPFWVHLSCVSLPHTVKHVRHKHPLNLTYSLSVDKSDHQFCQLCVTKMNIDYGVYFCSSCDFVAHLTCATDKAGIDNIIKQDLQEKFSNNLTFEQDSKDKKLDESIGSSYVVKKVNVEGDGNEIATEIEYFSHKHDLVLTNELDNNENCKACIRPISPPAFGCAECGFYLHKWCAELPINKRHPIHKHPLTLSNSMSVFWCDACASCYNGFGYNCEECWFCLDVQCSSILDSLTHEGHAHPLVLSNERGNCSACGKDEGHPFRCTICDFTLNFGCAKLPHMVRYKSHEHPFYLTYNTVDGGSDEYYCDICEELRDPKHWYYYCVQCDYPAHPKCILGEFPYIDFGHTYEFNTHQHSLTLVPWTKDQYLCDNCGVNQGSFFDYECTQCNFHIHPACENE